MAIAAELAEEDGSVILVGLEGIFFEIHMVASHLADVLVVPAGGVVDGAGIVHGADKIVHFLRVELTPALVEDDPHGNAGAVIQVLHHLRQLRLELGTSFRIPPSEQAIGAVFHMGAGHQGRGNNNRIVAPSAAGHVLPHQHTQSVAVVIPAQRLHLDVLSQHIVAHGFGHADIIGKRLVGGSGVQPVGPVALIQQAVVEEGLVVEKQPLYALFVLLHGEFAHGKIALDQILPAAHRKAVELGMVRGPGFKIRHGDDRRQRIGKAAELGISLCFSHSFRCDLHSGVVEIRGNAERFDVILGHGLHPHGLPDAALGRVPDAAPLGFLLATGMHALVRVVGDPDGDGHLVLFNGVGNIRLKGQVAAHMACHHAVVHPYGGLLVHSAEVQQHPFARVFLRQLHPAAVPEVFPAFQAALHAGQLRLWGKGDNDLAVKFGGVAA